MTAHGILLRHFHNHRHPAGIGSLGADDLRRLIECVGPRRIVPAEQWMERRRKGQLLPTDVCLSFDDNLRSQFDVAYPVLKEYGLTGFWFVNTAVLDGQLEWAEVGRYLRLSSFNCDADYVQAMMSTASRLGYADKLTAAGLMSSKPSPQGALHSHDAIQHQLMMIERALPAEAHGRIIGSMQESARISTPAIRDLLWMDEYTLRSLHDRGHVIGLHTHTHCHQLASLPVSRQRGEYAMNQEKLTAILGQKPVVMSHPDGSYGPQTLEILKDLGIEMGFCSEMSVSHHGQLEYPREMPAILSRRVAA